LIPAALIGSSRIDLILGESTDEAKDNDTLTAVAGGGLMATLGKELTPAIEKIKGTLTHIDSVLIPIKDILSDSTTSSIATALQRLPNIMKNVEDFTYSLNHGKLERILANVESITSNLKNNNDKIQNILTNFSSLSDSLNQANIKQIVTNANNAVAK